MKFCDRCFVEYEDDEIIQFDKESPRRICIPCKSEFDLRLQNFLIEFFNNQPERSKREDTFIYRPENYRGPIAIDCKPSKECDEYHKNSRVQINIKSDAVL